MKTQKFRKISGFWADENLGIRIVSAIYYIPDTTKGIYKFQCLKEKILKEKHQYFELKESILLDLPYKPANIIKFRNIFN